MLRRFAKKAEQDPRPHVLIVDEINRANLARVFGELLYLLEYRDRTVRLPYSHDLFGLPENLYMIGTMNTADRSIALVDFALRRRFHFIEFPADPAILRRWLVKNRPTMLEVAALLAKVNAMVGSPDFAIGFSYFMRQDLDEHLLSRVWERSIQPALTEYFFSESGAGDRFSLAKVRVALKAFSPDDADDSSTGVGSSTSPIQSWPMPSVTVQQYRSIPIQVGIGDDALTSLLIDYRDRIGVAPAIGGGITLTGGAHVGVISVPGLDVFVTPKIEPLAVFWMLAYADRLVTFLPTEVEFGKDDGLLEVLVRLFAHQTTLLVRRGLFRDYVDRTENRAFIRGRVELLEDARINLGLHHQAVCRFAEHTANVPHNQVLRTLTETLLRLRYRSRGIRETLAWNLGQLMEAEPAEISPRMFAAIQYSRLNRHYEPVVRLADLIVRHVTIRHEVGALRAPSFLVDMNITFQEFLTRLIDEAAASRGLRRSPGPVIYLDEGHEVRMKPDIVLTDGKTVRVAIDAKYKRIDGEADVYQALAYAKALNLKRVALVYPADGEVVPSTHRIRNDQVSVLVRTIPVGADGAGFVDLDLRAATAARDLIEELLGSLARREAA